MNESWIKEHYNIRCNKKAIDIFGACLQLIIRYRSQHYAGNEGGNPKESDQCVQFHGKLKLFYSSYLKAPDKA